MQSWYFAPRQQFSTCYITSLLKSTESAFLWNLGNCQCCQWSRLCAAPRLTTHSTCIKHSLSVHTIAVYSIINGSEQSAVLFSCHACVSGSLSLIKAQTAALELSTTALSLALYIQPDITTFSWGFTCSDDWSRLTWKDVFPAQSLNTGASSRWLKAMRYCSSVCKIMQYASGVLIAFHTWLLLLCCCKRFILHKDIKTEFRSTVKSKNRSKFAGGIFEKRFWNKSLMLTKVAFTYMHLYCKLLLQF